jgi:hypothetical protein
VNLGISHRLTHQWAVRILARVHLKPARTRGRLPNPAAANGNS